MLVLVPASARFERAGVLFLPDIVEQISFDAE